MKEFHPDSDTRAPADTDTAVSASNRRRDFGAGEGHLAAAALLAVALSLSLGLLFWSTAHKQAATGDNAAPSLTTGSATSSPNNSGVTPPASR